MYPAMIKTGLTLEDCAQFRAYAESHVDAFGKLDEGFWDGRVINASKIDNPEIRNKLLANRNFLKSELAARTKHYMTDPLYGDTLQIVRWLPGYELHPHADQANPDGSPHPFPWRDFAAITFLNDDFTGGELHFPHRALVVKPIPGTAIIFPGNLEYLHGVREVKTGVRYTIASFFTYDVNHADSFDAV